MTLRAGDTVLVRFPFTDLTATKLRPAVVLAERGDDLTILGIYSLQAFPAKETWVVLSTDDPAFAGTGLRITSVVKAERIAVVARSIVGRRLGSLSGRQMDAVRHAVKLALRLE